MNHVFRLCEMGGEYVYSICPGCGVNISKAGDCNTLEHCGFQICSFCGMSSLGEGIPYTHWDCKGKFGCPRYDDDTYITEAIGECYPCRHNVCYTETIPCCDNQHLLQRKKLGSLRLFWHLWFCLKDINKSWVKHIFESARKKYAHHHNLFSQLSQGLGIEEY